MRSAPFTRPTLIAAIELLEQHSQVRFNQVVLRLGLEGEITSAKMKPTAVELVGQGGANGGVAPVIIPDEYVTIAGKAPREGCLQGAEADDEVHRLLKLFGFATPLGHLDQATEAHTRSDWAACNSQTRTFFESLLDDIARNVRPEQAAQRPSFENRRALLAEIEFLAADRNEWTQDGKNYINSLFKMLHTEGSHTGLSDEDHSTFWLHVVLVMARTFLRRLSNGR